MTEYRHKTFHPELLDRYARFPHPLCRPKRIKNILINAKDIGILEMLADRRCALVAFDGADRVHLRAGVRPALNMSVLINHPESAGSRRMRNPFADHLAKFYWKPTFSTAGLP